MGLLTPLAVKIGALEWMPRLLPQIVWVDTNLQKVSRGRVSVLDIAGLPNLMLTVVGRKSGIPRQTPLLCVPDGDTWLIAGSYFGGPKMPVWVFKRFVGTDLITMWRWLRTERFDMGTSTTREILPEALTVRQWLARQSL